jgi:flagellar protein FlaI
MGIGKLRGYLYRKTVSKKVERMPATRAGQLLYSLKKQYPETFPKFRILPVRSLVSLPPGRDIQVKNIVYPVIRPYAYANIRYDEQEKTLVYHVIEPSLNDKEKAVLKKLKEGLVQIIDVTLEDIKHPEKIIEFLETSIQNLIDEYNFTLNEKEYLKLMYFIYRDFVGYNRIEVMLNDQFVEDIGCDGRGVPVYVVHQKFGSIKTNLAYADEEELREFVIKLAERCDRYISYAEPILDGTLKDGSRVQASLAGDVTTRGPTFSIRKFKETPFTPVEMTRLGTASPEMLAYLWFVVEHGANILITGGVSTGKTSMLNTISLFIPDESKIVSIEDTRELNLPHENWIPGVARTGFTGTGVGEVTMFELLRESFRQNPDYLIVGEVRGKEAYVMFQGMASGHPSISTMHAGSVDDVIKRLQTKPINLSPGLLDSLDIVVVMVHAREKGKSARRIKEISEIESIDIVTGQAHTNKVFVWLPAEDNFEYRGNSWLLSKISAAKGIPMSKVVIDIARRKKLLNWLYENNVTDMSEMARYINLYRRSPDQLDGVIKVRLREEKEEE